MGDKYVPLFLKKKKDKEGENPLKRASHPTTPIVDFTSKLPDDTYSLRIGKEVPEGDVNLAYLHTPRLQVDENISLIDTASTSDNVILPNQVESMVIANHQGQLEYADLIGEEVRTRAPKETFPSDQFSLTRKFNQNIRRIEHALYYHVELHYHYDSQVATPLKDGTYPMQKYTGNQIEVTDANGHPLDDSHPSAIFVQAHAFNPHIYSVRVYVHDNTDEVQTFHVRYNHIDQIVKDEHIASSQRQIQFYTNQDNRIVVDEQGKQLMEGGKLRIINGGSAYPVTSLSHVQQAPLTEEAVAIVPKTNGSGYELYVPQKSEDDPRVPRIFSHRVTASYLSDSGQTVKASAGLVTDWVLNEEALLPTERSAYTNGYKHVGLPSGGGRLSAREMIEKSLPFGTASIPSDAEYAIEDDNGNLLYHVTNLVDHPGVDSRIQPTTLLTPEASAPDLNQKPWINALQENTALKNNPFWHNCSIIPERQTTKWDFTWKATGQGYTEKKTNYETTWQACANIGFKKTIEPTVLDVLNKSKWATIGDAVNVDKWKYSFVPEMGKNVIELLDNSMDVVGFYQQKELIQGTETSLMDKSNYEFSVKVRLTDPVDDDMIGILFRVRDSQNYYMFAWEANDLATEARKYESDHGEGIVGVYNGCGRIVLDEYGLGVRNFDPQAGSNRAESWRWTKDKQKYLGMGLGNNHKRMFKATPSNKAAASNPSDEEAWNGNTRYPMDRTKCQFTDITNMTTGYNAKGWEYNKDYKITVVVTDSLFRVFINENVSSPDKGTLVCQGSDTTHSKGTYGIFCASQRWTYWYDLKMTEIEVDTVCGPENKVTFTDQSQKKLSTTTASSILEPLIQEHAKNKYNGAAYENFGNTAKTTGQAQVWIDLGDDYVYGKALTDQAGGTTQTPWLTEENGLSVLGTGNVRYHPDGHFTINLAPNTLPTDQIPSNVKGFQWNPPFLITGANVQLSLSGDTVTATASVPPIERIGTPYVFDRRTIDAPHEYQIMGSLFGSQGVDGIYQKLNIPSTVPIEEVLLRIERGTVIGVQANGAAQTQNPEFRVNYRFRCQKEGYTRMPVDQFQAWLGVNRIRLESILKDKKVDPGISVDIVAWTTFQELEAVPIFAIKFDHPKKMELQKPKIEVNQTENSNWYLRVRNGRFLKRLVLPYVEVASSEKLPEIYISYPQLLGMVTKPEELVEVDLEYTLQATSGQSLEYVNQRFHQKPWVLIEKEAPVILSEFAVQTRYAPIVLASKKEMSYLEVYSIRGNIRRNLRVADVDAAKGVIHLHDRLREQDEVYVRYAYQEDWYTYKGFSKGDHFFHLDLNPTPGHFHTVAVNGMHHWVPRVNDTESYIPEAKPSIELLVKAMHVYLRPSAIRYVDPERPTKNGTIIPGTIQSNVLFHTTEDWWFDPKDYRYDPSLLRLGKVVLQANSTKKDHFTILDTRTRGGGLDESITKEIIKQVNEASLHHWDIGYFDGEAYQENGVIIVRLPNHLLKSESNPNGFLASQIEAVVAKHKAYGVLPIIEYYEEKETRLYQHVIGNYEFKNLEHIEYFDAHRSKGNYQLRHIAVGAGDDYVLQLATDAIYTLTIPGHVLPKGTYQFQIKAIKERDTVDRSIGVVEIGYADQTKQRIQLGTLIGNQWAVYKQTVSIAKEVKYIRVFINEGNEQASGNILIDYIDLVPIESKSIDTAEIHEI